jgi:hypothetical protein
MYARTERKNMWLLAAAAAGLGVFPLAPLVMAGDSTETPTPMQADNQAVNAPPGFQTIKMDGESGIRTGLVKMTDRAVTKGDFNRLLAELSTQDKERAREFKGADQSKLDAIINQIQMDWKTKYGQEFSISDKNLVFDKSFAMAEFEVTDPSVAVANWPLPVMSGEAVAAGNHQASNDKDNARDAKLTKGRDVAEVRFPSMKGLSELTVSMIHELPMFWRVDVPNDRTGEQIYNDLTAQLTFIRDHSDKWPAHVDDAYRLVARHVVAALYGVPMHAHVG